MQLLRNLKDDFVKKKKKKRKKKNVVNVRRKGEEPHVPPAHCPLEIFL